MSREREPTVRPGQRLAEGGRPDEGLEAPPVAAPADRSVLVDGEVADLAGRAGAAPEHLATEHQAGTDAVGELDVGAVLDPLQRTASQLPESAEVGRVVHRDGRPQSARASRRRRRHRATRAGCSRSPPARHAVDGGRDPDADGPHVGYRLARLLDEVVEQARRPLHALVGVVARRAGAGAGGRRRRAARSRWRPARRGRRRRSRRAGCCRWRARRARPVARCGCSAPARRRRRRRAPGPCWRPWRGSVPSTRRSRPGSSRPARAAPRAPAAGWLHAGRPASRVPPAMDSRGKDKRLRPGLGSAVRQTAAATDRPAVRPVKRQPPRKVPSSAL